MCYNTSSRIGADSPPFRKGAYNMAGATLYTVIVADDEDELREAVCTMIPWEELGFRLAGSAGNGLDALQLVEKYEPDLLLTDIRMPFISGIELARQVREVRPATNIAFLSGYDDFAYAQQAIQYNIISYMLKPLTIDGLGKELRAIRQKIDAQYALFRKSGPVGGEQKVRAAEVMPLVLDGYAEPEPEAQLEAYAREVGLLRDVEDRPCYTVMVSTLLSREGANRTTPSFAASIDRLAAKYLRSVSFFSGGKVVTVLLGNPSDFEEYLHILADELPQMARRALDGRCHMGISRMVRSLASLHGPTGRRWRHSARASTAGRAPSLSGISPPPPRGESCCASGRWSCWISGTWTQISPWCP